jgi:hypothetical protein
MHFKFHDAILTQITRNVMMVVISSSFDYAFNNFFCKKEIFMGQRSATCNELVIIEFPYKRRRKNVGQLSSTL